MAVDIRTYAIQGARKMQAGMKERPQDYIFYTNPRLWVSIMRNTVQTRDTLAARAQMGDEQARREYDFLDAWLSCWD